MGLDEPHLIFVIVAVHRLRALEI